MISAILSEIIKIFSLFSIPKTSLTWKEDDFPTMHTADALLLIRLFNPGSLAALFPNFLVMPKAVNKEFWKSIFLLKNSSSVGLAPGQPPSI